MKLLSSAAALLGAETHLRGMQQGLELPPPSNVWQLASATKEFFDPTISKGCAILSQSLGSSTGCEYVDGTTILTYPGWFEEVPEISVTTPSAAPGATGIILPANCDFILAGQHIFVGLSCLTPMSNGWDITSTLYDGAYASEQHIGLYTEKPPVEIGPNMLPYKVSYSGNPPGCTEERKPENFDPVSLTTSMRTDVCGFDASSWYFPSNPLPTVTCETAGDTLTLYYGNHFSTLIPNGNGQFEQETCWSHTLDPRTGKNWGDFSQVTFTCDTPPGGDPPGDDDEYVCETVFAESANSQCFIDLDVGINRWGWTTLVQTKPTSEPLTFDLWAGAAHCDTENGQNAGSVEIRPDGSIAYILADGVILTEYHVNVGSTPVLEVTRGKKTSYSVAPGQYTFSGSSFSQSEDGSEVINNPWSGEVVLDGVSVDKYPSHVIFHGVACSKDW